MKVVGGTWAYFREIYQKEEQESILEFCFELIVIIFVLYVRAHKIYQKRVAKKIKKKNKNFSSSWVSIEEA